MGGPSAAILLHHSLTEEQITGLEQWLYSITSRLEGKRGKWGPFWIKDVSLIGLLDWHEVCTFSLTIEKVETDLDFLEAHRPIDKDSLAELRAKREQFIEYLGFVPEQCINVGSGCNRRIDHQLLGQLTLLLAERYDGIIDFGGAFYPPNNVPLEDVTVEEVEEYVKELSLPGRIFHMYYITAKDTMWIYHLIDPEFLRAWLQHPRFHMIK